MVHTSNTILESYCLVAEFVGDLKLADYGQAQTLEAKIKINLS